MNENIKAMGNYSISKGDKVVILSIAELELLMRGLDYAQEYFNGWNIKTRDKHKLLKLQYKITEQVPQLKNPTK